MQINDEKKLLVPFFLDKYYEKIENFTFKTYFFELLPEELQLITDFQDFRYKKSYKMTEKDKQILKLLEKKLDEFINTHKYENGFFIKLNFRSPKDGFPLRNDLIPQLFESELSSLLKKWEYKKWIQWLPNLKEPDFVSNAKWISFVKTLNKLSVCSSGEEVLSLILSSLRIYEDLSYFSKEKIDKVYIAFREFDPKIDCLYEFRCVIAKNELKSIMQYNHPWLIEELLKDSNVLMIKEKINYFWEKNIREKLIDYKNYVLDIAIIQNEENLKVIEINPIETSGLGLLKKEDWNNENKNIVFKVRNHLDIPYQDHWEGELQYLLKDYCDHQRFGSFLGNNK